MSELIKRLADNGITLDVSEEVLESVSYLSEGAYNAWVAECDDADYMHYLGAVSGLS